MGNVIMKAQQITYGASNVEKALDDLKAPELIELNKRMDAIDAWKANVHEETYTGSELTIENALALPARSLITEINAIQDLHGYDKPWVGGAGKNKYSILISADSFSNQGGGTHSGSDGVLTINVSAVDDGAYSQTTSELNKAFDNMPIGNVTYSFYMKASVTGNVAIGYLGKGNTWINATTSWVRYNITYNKAESGTANFIIYNKVAGARTIEIKDFMIEVGNSMSAYEPYSNICPISGRDSVAVDDVGKNVLPNTYTGYTRNGITWTVDSEGIIDADGTATAHEGMTIISQADLQRLLAEYGDLIITGCPTGGGDSTYQIVTSFNGSYTYDRGNGLTLPANGTYSLGLMVQIRNGYTARHVKFKVMLRPANTSATYVPYAHSSATIQLGTTVYGADINWVTGVCTVDRVLADNSLLTVFRNNTAGTGTLASFNKTTNGYASRNAYTTSIFKPQTVSQWEALDADTILTDSGTGYCVICTDVPNQTQEQLQQWLTDKGAQICLYLATPTTIQLTPAQLEMLKGYNRVTIESGSIELKALVLGGDN